MANTQQLVELSPDLQALIDASPDAVIVLTPDHVVARFNAAAEREYGYRADRMIGRDIRDYWMPEVRSPYAGLVDEVMTGAAVGPSVREGKRRDGTSFWLSVTGVPIRTPGGEIIATYWQSRDISAEHLAQAERDERITRLMTAFAVSPVGMFITSFAGQHVMVSPALCRMFGYGEEEFLSFTAPELHHPDDSQRAREVIRSLRTGETTSSVQRGRRRHKDGHYIWVEETTMVLNRDPHTAFQLLVLSRDVDADVEEEQRAKFLIDHDHLTGLLNRRGLEHLAAQHRDAALGGDHWGQTRPGSLLVIDLDGFKLHNDTYGHAAGDRLLIATADALRSVLRDGDAAARVGGDEFAVLLPNTDGSDAEARATRLLEAISAVSAISGNQPGVTASIGIADFTTGTAMSDAAQRADAAMYRAKRHGKARWSR